MIKAKKDLFGAILITFYNKLQKKSFKILFVRKSYFGEKKHA
jgi:hypothetical protein